MKALVIITGRGLGGDAVIAYNIINALEKEGVNCEIALDKSAPGILFEKKGYSWHKISIPQAGGHVATKASAFKGAFKMFLATFGARRLIKKVNPDFVVGIIGGGAIVASVGAKLARTTAVSVISTPLDSKVCPKFNHCYVLPELDMFRYDELSGNLEKSYYPLNDDVGSGNSDKALEKLKENHLFDETKKTILFSSGSSLFKGMIDAANRFSESNEDYNILMVGHPLKSEYDALIDRDKIIYLGYIDWLSHLYDFIDLAVLTDDGVMVQEAIASEIPVIALTKVKWGRYHNMEGIYKGAIIESEINDVGQNIKKAFNNYDSLKSNVADYSPVLLQSKENLAKSILKKVK